jgi:excisionase family DNA binding protein
MQNKNSKIDCESGMVAVKEAAEYLGISSGTLRNWLSAKRLDYVKVGRLTRICRDVLARYVTTHTVKSHETV